MDGEDEDINCHEGEIIMVDLVTFDITCGADDDRCPGAFSVGCDTDTEAPTTAETTTTSSSDSIWISLFLITASVSKFLFQLV